jgi:hypothetical protein
VRPIKPRLTVRRLALSSATSVAALGLLLATSGALAATSLRFYGNGVAAPNLDRVKIAIDEVGDRDSRSVRRVPVGSADDRATATLLQVLTANRHALEATVQGTVSESARSVRLASSSPERTDTDQGLVGPQDKTRR